MTKLKNAIAELYKKVATSIPPDIENALKESQGKTPTGSDADSELSNMLSTIRTSRVASESVCEDIGVPVFYVKAPKEIGERQMQVMVF